MLNLIFFQNKQRQEVMPDWDNYSKEMQIVNQDFNQPHGLRMNKFRDHLLQISIIVSAVSTAPGY